MAVTIVFGIVFAGTGLVAPLLVRQILVWHAEGNVETGALGIIIVILVGSFVLRAAGRYGYGAFSHIVAYRAQHLMLVTLNRHIQSLPHRFFEQRRTGNLISRAVGDVEAVEDFIAHGIPEATLAATIPTAMVIALGIINWQADAHQPHSHAADPAAHLVRDAPPTSPVGKAFASTWPR